ncbi:maleylpyruvate isomerase family mycothiol-dependent enzyme [Streptomyces sp. NPDC051940]|uniref:maleylpyruvate isomerase family mycothiol-dependent enzyme n=1 Tax=Streptomyces sp. NPDC051940 TaxID=3155675 RepID=UPI003426B9C2
MTDGHDTVRDLLGAYALDALTPGEEKLLSEHLAGCADCAAEADSLRAVVGALDGPHAAAWDGPPGTAVLATAVRRRSPARRTAAHAAPYAAAVSALEALLREADERGAWHVPVIHGWDVQGTVAHLLAADEPLRRLVDGGEPDTPPLPWREEWAARTASVIAYEAGFPPAETRARWRAQAQALLASRPAQDPDAATARVTLLGMPLPLADHFLVRAFETWIHTDDIGRALGVPVPAPPTDQLGLMVDLGLRLLTAALRGVVPAVRLTVGGHAPVLLGTAPARADVTLDPLDFCFLIGDRLAPARVPHRRTGDEAAASSVLRRAASLAWL